MGSQVAVIGAGGFIGRHLCGVLAQEGNHTVLPYGRGGSPDSRVSGIDFTDSAQLRKIGEHADIIYYLVSETIPSTSWADPFIDIEKNLKPFLRFMESIAGSRTRKVVFISSGGTVYGTTAGKVSEDADKHPFSPYGIVKLTMENYLEYYRRRAGLNYDIYRVSNVYGAGQNTGKGLGIINTFLEKIVRNETLVVYGDGSATRNFVYVKDVARLLALSVSRPDSSDVYNLASDSAVSIRELIELMRGMVKENVDVRYESTRQSDNTFIDLDNRKIKKAAGDFSFTSLEQGITETYRWLEKETRQSNV